MWSRPIPAAGSSSGLYLFSHLLQARWSSQIKFPASSSWVEWDIVVPTTNGYSLTGKPTAWELI
jgi:hypothetical protein